MLVALGLLVASLALSAWWAQAIIAEEYPVLTSLALAGVQSDLAHQLQAQAGAAGLPPGSAQAVQHALAGPALEKALDAGNPGAAVSSALVKADPALARVLGQHPLTVPPVGRTVTRVADRVRPIAAAGLGLGALACALALALERDRSRVLRRIGSWGVVAGGLPLLVGRVLPEALGLSRGHGALASVTRTELAATEPLRALSLGLCVAGAVLAVAGTSGPYLVRWVRHGFLRSPVAGVPDAPGAPVGIGMPPGVAPGVPAGVRNTWSASGVDVRL